MFLNVLNTLLILQIIFITQDVVLSVDVYAREEHQNLRKEQNNEIGRAQQIFNKVDSSEEELNNNDKDSFKDPLKLSSSNEYSKHIHKQVKIFKQKRPITSPLWKFKDVSALKEEPGFDLTHEELTKFKIWKDGVIPYYIDVVSFSDKVIRDKIRHHLNIVNSATNVNFMELLNPPVDDQERWLFFINRRALLGCADHTVKNFTNHGVQQVVLGYDCMATRGELAEAIMAIVGVPAQHNAPDRDNYINVNMDNIMPDKRYLFEKLKDDEWLFHDLEYDFESITHYDIHKYSINGRVTINSKKKNIPEFEPARSFSNQDLQKIKMLYNFITRNTKLKTPVCKKLFESGSKFKELISSHNNLKPRSKPTKYSGVTNSEEHKSEPLNKVHKKKKRVIIDDGENEQDRHDKKHNDEDETYHENGYKHSENANKQSEEEKRNDDKEQLDDSHQDDDDVKNVAKTKLKIKRKDPLIYLSDYGSSGLIQKLNYVTSNKKYKPDPLSFLSDYQTGDERDRKRMLPHINTKNFKYSR